MLLVHVKHIGKDWKEDQEHFLSIKPMFIPALSWSSRRWFDVSIDYRKSKCRTNTTRVERNVFSVNKYIFQQVSHSHITDMYLCRLNVKSCQNYLWTEPSWAVINLCMVFISLDRRSLLVYSSSLKCLTSLGVVSAQTRSLLNVRTMIAALLPFNWPANLPCNYIIGYLRLSLEQRC